jgi:hypothetical protein
MSDLRRDGYAIASNVLDRDAVAELRGALAAVPGHADVRRRRAVYGIRHVLEHCLAARAIACSPRVRALVEPVLGPRCVRRSRDALRQTRRRELVVVLASGQRDRSGGTPRHTRLLRVVEQERRLADPAARCRARTDARRAHRPRRQHGTQRTAACIAGFTHGGVDHGHSGVEFACPRSGLHSRERRGGLDATAPLARLRPQHVAGSTSRRALRVRGPRSAFGLALGATSAPMTIVGSLGGAHYRRGR